MPTGDIDLPAPPQAVDWGAEVEKEALKQGVDPKLARSVAKVESGGNPKAVSPKGAIGIMQLMPDTASDMKVNAFDPHENIRGGIGYLKKLSGQYGGDTNRVLAAYNAGPAKVDNPPLSTMGSYIPKVRANMAAPSLPMVHASDSLTNPDEWMQKHGNGAPDPLEEWVKAHQVPDASDVGNQLTHGGIGQVPISTARMLMNPEVWAPVAAAGAASAIFPPSAPILAAAAKMTASGAASAGAQYFNNGEVSLPQTAMDALFSGGSDLLEGGAARISAMRQLPKAITAEQSGLQKISAMEKLKATMAEASRKSESDAMLGFMPQDMTGAGSRTSENILSRFDKERGDLKSNFQDIVNRFGNDKIGKPKVVKSDMLDASGQPFLKVLTGADDTRPTFQQLHARQANLGDMAAASFKNGKMRDWKNFSGQQDKVLDKMEQYLGEKDPDALKQWQQTRAGWADMKARERNSAAQKLMKQSDDSITKALLSDRTLSGPRNQGGTFKGGTQSPNEIISSLRDVMNPSQFDEYKNATRGRLVEASLNTSGEVDPVKLSRNINKMGGNFPALFDASEQKELTGAVSALKNLETLAQQSTSRAEVADKAMAGVPGAMSAKIPSFPKHTKVLATMGAGAMLGGATLNEIFAPSDYSTPITKGTRAIALASAAMAFPGVVKTLLKSPEARQFLASKASSNFADPMWDKLASLVTQGGLEAGAHQFILPEPPQKPQK